MMYQCKQNKNMRKSDDCQTDEFSRDSRFETIL